MNTHLQTTFIVLISCCVLALGLFAAAPATPLADASPARSIQAEPAIAAHVAAVARQIDARAATATLQDTAAASKPSRHASGKSRRIRQSMAMPFFSFAPRG